MPAGTSKKMMTDTLRALERDGLVSRRIYAEVPLRVEYSLTSKGWSITEPLLALGEWDRAHGDEMCETRDRNLIRSAAGAETPGLVDRLRTASVG